MNDRAVIALACQIAKLRDKARMWKQTALAYENEGMSARADAVTRAEADRVRMEALRDELRREREAHAGLKDALGIQAAKEAGKVLGMVEGEGLRGAAERVVKERDCAKAEWARHEERCKALSADVLRLTAEIERLKKPPRQHPVAVGEWVERTGGGGAYPIGTVAQVNQYSPSGDYLVRLAGQTRIVIWFKQNCTPCDPPEASHDTPEGKQVAGSVIRNDRNTEPKPGDTVRLVRVPTQDEYPHDTGRWEPNWGGIGDYMRVHHVGNNLNGTRIVRAVFGLEWPVSCIEVVRTDPDEIKVGDVVEVFQATDANWTRANEIGIKGTVERVNMRGHRIPVVYLSNGGAYALCDVRKVTP